MSTDIVGKENLPNVYIKEIVANRYSRVTRLSATVQVYDHNGSWYGDQRIKSNLKIMVVYSASQAFNQSITTGRSALTPKHIRRVNGYDRNLVKFKTFSLNNINRQAFENEVEPDTQVFPYRCSFRERNRPNVSIFAVAYFDVEQFSNENGLDLRNRSLSAYHGAIVGEKVFEDGVLVTETNMFKKGLTTYLGPVHAHFRYICDCT